MIDLFNFSKIQAKYEVISVQIVCSLSETAMKTSFVIWIARDNKGWKPDKIVWKHEANLAQTPEFTLPTGPKVHKLATSTPKHQNSPRETASNQQ